MSMRIPLIALAITCAACSSSTGVDHRNSVKPGPSMTGLWNASDTAQHHMVLQLTQKGDTISGEGWVNLIKENVLDSTDTLTAVQGHNVIWPPCCQPGETCAPCALMYEFPVSLTVADAKGDSLLVLGGFDGKDTNRVNIEVFTESPGFPFYLVTQPLQLTFTRQQMSPQDLSEQSATSW